MQPEQRVPQVQRALEQPDQPAQQELQVRLERQVQPVLLVALVPRAQLVPQVLALAEEQELLALLVQLV